MSLIGKYFIVYLLSGIKFIFGPTLGLAYNFSILETILVTVLGMMSTVYLLSYFGPQIRGLYLRIFGKRKQKVFTPRKRRFVRIWKRYGIQGIAFLTPLLLTPIGGAFMANALGAERKDIFRWMWIFGSFWAIVLTLATKYAAWLLREFYIL